MVKLNLLADLATPEEVSSIPSLSAATEVAANPRAVPGASEEGLALATSLQLRTTQPSVIVFAGTAVGVSSLLLVEEVGKALVELGAEVLLLNFGRHDGANQPAGRLPFQPILARQFEFHSDFEEQRPGLYALNSANGHWLAAQDAKELFPELRKRFGYVLVAAPSYGEDFATRLLASHADGIVLSLVQDQHKRSRLQEIQRQLKADHLKSLGFILTGGAKK